MRSQTGLGIIWRLLGKPEKLEDVEKLTGTSGTFQVETEKRGTGQGRKTEPGHLGRGGR